MKFTLSIVLVCFLGSFQVFAQKANNGTFAISKVAVSPLSASLGGSQIASFAGDVNQLVVNPALLDSSVSQQLSLGYLNYLADINQATVSYAQIIDSVGLVSGYFRYFDYGVFTERDEVGNQLGQFKIADYEVGFSFTRPYSDRISYGVTLKQYFSGSYQYFAYGVAADAGAYYHSQDNGFTAGLTLDDIGAKLVDYADDGISAMSPSLNVGITKKFSKAPLRFGFQYNNLQKWDLAENDADRVSILETDPLTGEVSRKKLTLDNLARHLCVSATILPTDNFNLMIGYNFRRRLELSIGERAGMVGFSFGAMVKIKRFTIQYGLSSYHLNGTSNQIALTTNINQWYRKTTVK
ncbi:MAG: type IX secretion system protein PorQ [Flavobacteriales bacterium]